MMTATTSSSSSAPRITPSAMAAALSSEQPGQAEDSVNSYGIMHVAVPMWKL